MACIQNGAGYYYAKRALLIEALEESFSVVYSRLETLKHTTKRYSNYKI